MLGDNLVLEKIISTRIVNLAVETLPLRGDRLRLTGRRQFACRFSAEEIADLEKLAGLHADV